MSMSGSNPVLTPIRRWVLYSRTHLAITVAASVAVLFGLGAVFGENTQPSTSAAATESSIATPNSGSTASVVTYDLDEVSESLVAVKSAAWASTKAPATAMAYAHTFVDTIPSDAMWSSSIGRYTTNKPDEDFLSARPRTPVVITGPTTSTLVDGSDGARIAQVIVPTQAGDLRISLRVVDGGANGQRWVVDTPLPTLDLSKLDRVAETSILAPSTVESDGPPTSTTVPVPTTQTSSPSPSYDLETPGLSPSAPASPPSTSVNPPPVPGPIPIPDLDTPLPGAV
ncbi:hypothetical protein [Rhodococcoides fascians]|uniref:hypothetical protein n=1 Tax=Rhodococcoides fascians TaxID=1828 RepID=UPI00050CA29D